MFDYIIVGAGSAGCVLANRLSENADLKICLIEAGEEDNSPLIHTPAGLIAIVPRKGKYNWGFETVPQPELHHRCGFQPRGKGLGGSSSINAMVYIRGHRLDYDDWAALGNQGWDYQSVLPYFKKSECFVDGENEFHGSQGGLSVSHLLNRSTVSEAFVNAAGECQIPFNTDFNGNDQLGVGYYHVTQRNGERCSAAKAFLHPIRHRSNLTVITAAQALDLIIDNHRAIAIRYAQNKMIDTLYAKHEIILASGAFGSPTILQRSGIGDPDALAAAGVKLKHRLPGVGANLQDHLDITLSFSSHTKDTFGLSAKGIQNLFNGLLDYRRNRSGMLTSNFAEAGAFLKTIPQLDRPDIQLHFVRAVAEDHGRSITTQHGYSCHICQLRPKSRGTVRLRPNHPFDDPLIDPNYLGDAADLEVLVQGVKLTRKILEAPALRTHLKSERLGAGVVTDGEITHFIRDKADTIYHPVGTCKMGQDAQAVVDQRLRVHGMQGLRVVDASIMPTLVGGNTNAPTIMIAEKASEMILSDLQPTLADIPSSPQSHSPS